MARYRKIETRTWGDVKFRRLSPLQPSGQALWLYLLTCPVHSNIPGLFSAGAAGMAEALGWSPEAFLEAFAEVFGEGLAEADWEARVVWIPNAIKCNAPASPSVVKGWKSQWDDIPECPLKLVAWEGLKAFLEGMSVSFVRAFTEACRQIPEGSQTDSQKLTDRSPKAPQQLPKSSQTAFKKLTDSFQKADRQISKSCASSEAETEAETEENLKPSSADADTRSPDAAGQEPRIETPVSGQAGKPHPASKRFAAFWDTSPRRGSRKASLAAFEAILKKEPDAADEIERGLSRAKRSDQWLSSVLHPAGGVSPGAYVGHLERFLRDQRWRADVTWPPYTRRELSDADVEAIWKSFREIDSKAQAHPQDAPEPVRAFRPEDQALIDLAKVDEALERSYVAMRLHWLRTLTDESYANWIEPMRLMGRAGKKILLTVDTAGQKAWIEDEYLKQIRELMGAPVVILAPVPVLDKAA